jgi:hypothetical protein
MSADLSGLKNHSWFLMAKSSPSVQFQRHSCPSSIILKGWLLVLVWLTISHRRWTHIPRIPLSPQGGTGRNIFYDGVTTTRDEKTARMNRAIDQVLIGEIGLTRDELSFIWADRKGYTSPASR